MCESLGMLETSNFGKYLGFPLRHRGASRRQFNFVADQVMGKLAGWKAKFLSFAGRAVLVIMSCKGLLSQFTYATSWIKLIETSFGDCRSKSRECILLDGNKLSGLKMKGVWGSNLPEQKILRSWQS